MNEGGKPDGTLNFYLRLNNPTHIAKNVIFITMTLVGDSFVVSLVILHERSERSMMAIQQSYRLWIVWNRAWWIIILPIGLLFATASTYSPSIPLLSSFYS